MGSSPVTATISSARKGLGAHLERRLAALGSTPGEPLLVAFSGGTDSTALLLGLLACRGHGRDLRAAHLDHAADEGSAARADRAEATARQLGVGFVRHRLAAPVQPGRHGAEAAAREARYRWLDEQRLSFGSRFVLTGHHADDQIETVLLRLSFGSGLYGLAAMQPRRGTILRPLLDVRRTRLAAVIAESGIAVSSDPTNADLSRPRNRLRRLVLPALVVGEPAIGDHLLAIARRADPARRRVEAVLRDALLPRHQGADAVEVPLQRLRSLPPLLQRLGLDLLHHLVGRPLPPRRRAAAQLLRQLAAGNDLRCDAGDGWRWRRWGAHLRLEPRPTPVAAFAYTFDAPGTAILPEIDRRLEVSRASAGPWVFERWSHRGALGLDAAPAGRWLVRNRRDGDRIQPLGSHHERKLKDVLIDQKIPREQRDALPLLVVDGRIAWVPGVVTDHRRRVLPGDREVWRIEVSPT